MFTRFFHTTVNQLARRRVQKNNAGIKFQLKELQHAEELERDPEGFGNMESDFMGVHGSHVQHESEVLKERDRIRQFMVRHKYFREEKYPNMLTYAEKEQIRLLNTRDPEEWTTERLAESFPATPPIIAKILKAKWRPHSEKRIRQHDESVIRNWSEFKNGTIKLPFELIEHLNKFADRKVEDIQIDTQNWPTRPKIPNPKRKDFLQIITTCKKYSDENNVTSQPLLQSGTKENSTSVPPAFNKDDETFLLDKVINKKKMRLKELKRFHNIPETVQAMPSETSLEKEAIEHFGNPSGTGIIKSINNNQLATMNYIEKFESNEITISVDDQKRYEMSTIKHRIHIPRKVWKKGATYRVEDCYYDDDGEFMYRVPGMTGSTTYK